RVRERHQDAAMKAASHGCQFLTKRELRHHTIWGGLNEANVQERGERVRVLFRKRGQIIAHALTSLGSAPATVEPHGALLNYLRGNVFSGPGGVEFPLWTNLRVTDGRDRTAGRVPSADCCAIGAHNGE